MINYHYQLVAPRKIVKKIFDENTKNKIVVKPTYLSICAADQRYFQGKRSPDILQKKLPISLIHEAVGEIVLDNNNEFNIGDKVVMLPNLNINKSINENYDPQNMFMSSDTDGFMQQNVILDKNQLIPFNFDPCVGVFSELLSVAIHAIESLKPELQKANIIGIWGDGNLGYLLNLYLSNKFPQKKIYIYGKNDDKLEFFGTASKRINVFKNEIKKVDVAFEVVGGYNSAKVINQIIETINPNGTICLLGVSEDHVSLNTRMILEKGLKLVGRSRSTKDDFQLAIKFLSNKTNQTKVKKIIGKVIEVRNIKQIEEAFDYDYTHPWKTIIKWEM